MIPLFAQDPVLPVEVFPTPEVDWFYLWPLVILALSGIVLVTITSIIPSTRRNGIPALYTAASAVLAFAFLPRIQDRLDELTGSSVLVLGGAIKIDGLTVFVTGVVCVVIFLVALVFDDYLRREGFDGPEWYVLMLLSATGAVLLAAANDLIMVFVALEIMSIAVYVLAALHLRRSESQEAGFKYFVLGSFASAVFLYGIALTYGATGSTSLDTIATSVTRFNGDGLRAVEHSSMILVAMAFLLVGLGFKVSAVPFQSWTPDVYEGAPTPVVGFMASAVKIAAVAVMLRIFVGGFDQFTDDWRPVLAVMAVASVLVGAALAVIQTNIKRMLALSSVTHAGFMLIGVFAAADSDEAAALLGRESVLFYMMAYSVLVVGTFAVLTAAAPRGDAACRLEDYNGLARRQPLLAAALVVLLFGQAGIPFTSGFFAKFGVIMAAASGGDYLVAAAAMVAAVVGAFLYLRIVVAVFLEGGPIDEAEDAPAALPGPVVGSAPVPVGAWIAIGASVAFTLVVGVFPDLVSDLVSSGALSG